MALLFAAWSLWFGEHSLQSFVHIELAITTTMKTLEKARMDMHE